MAYSSWHRKLTITLEVAFLFSLLQSKWSVKITQKQAKKKEKELTTRTYQIYLFFKTININYKYIFYAYKKYSNY